MPRYDYRCCLCGSTRELVTRAGCDEVDCDRCGGRAVRQFPISLMIQTPEHFRHDRNWCLPDDRAGYEEREKSRDRVYQTFKAQPKDTSYRDALVETVKRAKALGR